LFDQLKVNQIYPADAARQIAIIHGDRLSGNAFHGAIDKLVQFARLQNPDWIVGLHPGGRLISTYVAEQLGVAPDRCLFLRTDLNRMRAEVDMTLNLRFEAEPVGRMEGKVLVVDDVSRTGRTIKEVGAFLAERTNSGLASIRGVCFAVLVRAEVSIQQTSVWAAYTTRERNINLPWSPLSNRIDQAYAEIQARYGEHLEQHRRLVFDFEYARTLFHKYLLAEPHHLRFFSSIRTIRRIVGIASMNFKQRPAAKPREAA
jgi:adenine/guanine phosphoribosyltransferase-like PRPP-binding protein